MTPGQGRIQDFKLGGAHLKKLRRAEGGAKIFGVFRVKNHDFTPESAPGDVHVHLYVSSSVLKMTTRRNFG